MSNPIKSIPDAGASCLAYFDYRTIGVKCCTKHPARKMSAHCLKNLALFRLDLLLEIPDAGGEIWGIAIIASERIFPVTPAFATIETAAGFALELDTKHDWLKVDRSDFDPLIKLVHKALIHNQGVPLMTVLKALDKADDDPKD